MSTHGRPPSTLYTTTVILCCTIVVVATFFGSVSFAVWLYLTQTVDLSLKWAIGSGAVAAIAGAVLRKLL